MIKNRIKSYYSLSMRLDIFAKFKYESSTVIVFVGIRYSMRDLLSDLNNYACRANIAICVIGPNSTWLVSTRRHDSTHSTLSSESRRACRASRVVLFQHGGRRTNYSARLYKFSRFYMLLHTQILFVSSNKIN